MNEDEFNMIYDKLDRIEEKVNLLNIEIDKLVNRKYDNLIYEFYRDVITDPDGELHFLAYDSRVNNFFSKFLYRSAEGGKKNENKI